MMPPHGTRRRYGRGCKCAPCRAANASYDRGLRAKASIPDEKPAPVADPTAPAPKGKVAAKIEDFEFLISVGEAPDRAADRVGWNPLTARRALERHGRYDLSAHLRVAT